MRYQNRKHGGFSLVELVIVIVILGIIAAVAIPRISSGTRNAGESALRANLQTLRNAIDWYYAEHNTTFPGVKAAGGAFGAAGEAAAFENQLIKYTNAAGAVSADKDAAFPFGPYVRGNFPALPVGSNASKATVKMVPKVTPLVDGDTDTTTGWVFNPTTGQIIPNLGDAEVGNDGNPYNTY